MKFNKNWFKFIFGAVILYVISVILTYDLLLSLLTAPAVPISLWLENIIRKKKSPLSVFVLTSLSVTIFFFFAFLPAILSLPLMGEHDLMMRFFKTSLVLMAGGILVGLAAYFQIVRKKNIF